MLLWCRSSYNYSSYNHNISHTYIQAELLNWKREIANCTTWDMWKTDPMGMVVLVNMLYMLRTNASTSMVEKILL